MSNQANDKLVEIMRDFRNKMKYNMQGGKKPSYVPMSFKSMIQFFSYKMQRKYLTEVLSVILIIILKLIF